MRFPRNVKILRGQLEVAPFACVFVLLLIFLLLQSNFIYTTGVKIELPTTDNLPGTLNPTVVVAVDRAGQLYFANQIMREMELQEKLAEAVARYRAGRQELTLVVQADKTVPYEIIVRLAEVARAAGIKEVLQATRPSAHTPP
ncbi:MAG: biopolymer transporter ExbD [Verrucomicrobia bacterium]|nr:biopolymer transporter ExbD [Verrucomicrobiota bacterium]